MVFSCFATIFLYEAIGYNGTASPKANYLKTDGLYHWVRHPIYALRLMVPLGIFVIFPHIASWLFVVVFFLETYSKIIIEEAGLYEQFGDRYSDYRLKVPGALFPSIRMILKRMVKREQEN